MKIHIVGASCAGSTTLGNALSAQTGLPYFDTDFYFWEPSEIPFTIKRDRDARITMLRDAVALHPNHIIGGSLVSWGNEWLAAFDLVVFLYVPPEIRIQRLKNRELERYGDIIYTDPERISAYQKFLEWAEAYDTNAPTGRSLHVHEAWLSRVTCPVLEIRGDTTVAERVELILNKMKTINPPQ
ncbi:shikimate kinase [Mucilaginibacter terrae]|uniref:Adenylate kinase family enzyme n=1 Tax=Mucilaginibacter terrae TaxID=1955052 RepID=A0ABU3GXX2_9SPHI|nr:shikimate kinase [Mucilaginibacter terrae]MDT3404626.1 adenylate kinase family enzyme [Mucilaginibacter terrae]